MKFKFTSKSKAQAEKFQKYIKADRNLDATLAEKDSKFHVEYSIADYCPSTPSTTEAHCEYVKVDDLQCLLSQYAQYFYQEMQYQFNWVWSELEYIEQAFYNHQKGHLPPISGAEKMQKALDVLGVGGDYEVQKPIVWVQASKKQGASVEVDISAKK